MRRAPKNGYDFREKQQYRNILWSQVSHIFLPFKGAINTFIMPSQEGTEIAVAESFGFKTSRMLICDEKAAYVAIHKRDYPDIQTMGVNASRVAEYADKKSIHFANLDLCGTAVGNFQTVHDFMASGVMFDPCLIAVTMLKGRERVNEIQRLSQPGDDPIKIQGLSDLKYKAFGSQPIHMFRNATEGTFDTERILSCVNAIEAGSGMYCVPLRIHQYFSTQPMMWALFHCFSPNPSTFGRMISKRMPKSARRL